MKIHSLTLPDTQLMEPAADFWNRIPGENIALAPTPIAATKHLSPFMALKTQHGSVSSVDVKFAHNEKHVFARLRWQNPMANTTIRDLDEFSDGAAIMFPLTPDANAFSMGDEVNPVNVWLWKADKTEPFDVCAWGWGSSQRRPGSISGLKTRAGYDDGFWNLVFMRPLRSGLTTKDVVNFSPRSKSGIAVAIWNGGNKERAAEKSFSGNWKSIEIEP